MAEEGDCADTKEIGMRRLLLEGGGQRSIFTVGVLDCFMDEGISFDEIYGISAGALTASSYVSGDRGRALKQMEMFTGDKNYISIRNRFKTGSVFNWEYILKKIPDELLPMNYEAFRQNPTKLFAGAYECETGRTVYFPVKDLEGDFEKKVLQATASLPYFSEIVSIGEYHYMDGGIGDSFALSAFRDDGAKTLLVETQDPTFEKEETRRMFPSDIYYRKYPHLVHDYAARPANYNNDRIKAKQLEKEGKLLILEPANPVEVSKTESDIQKLKDLYEEGYRCAEEKMPEIRKYLEI